jgi:pantoate kinase
MKEATAFAPGHLTGLFQIRDESPDPLRKGARGSGVSLDLGVYTRVAVEPSDVHSHVISINGRRTDAAFVSENVLGKIRPLLAGPLRVTVEVALEAPLGAGFGSSGGGALSLALALNEAAGVGLSRVEAAQVAHVAEIECGTGLGSVFAALSGGFGVLLKPGAPGVGEAVRYPDTKGLRVVYLYFAPIPTKEALSNPDLRRRINELGGRSVDELGRELTPARFMEFSRRFSEHVGLITPRMRRTMDAVARAGFTSTMAMFGEVIFSLVDEDDAPGLASVLEEATPGYEAVVAGVDDGGARLVWNAPTRGASRV